MSVGSYVGRGVETIKLPNELQSKLNIKSSEDANVGSSTDAVQEQIKNLNMKGKAGAHENAEASEPYSPMDVSPYQEHISGFDFTFFSPESNIITNTPQQRLRALMLLYSNRAATRMSLGRMKDALGDCMIDPNFSRLQLRAAN
ncbi:hypothetical protein V6N11_004050 [Hibiscus sabdariffa]|uniref:Uncharacterized protein n=1 Tax=Hibiscus sabdariffa TaxID=183260 RepID=A0ABR2SFJ2_9ROSI